MISETVIEYWEVIVVRRSGEQEKRQIEYAVEAAGIIDHTIVFDWAYCSENTFSIASSNN